MARLITIAVAALFLLQGCTSEQLTVVGEYCAVTEMEWTFTINLRQGGEGDAVISVFSEEGEVAERRLSCTWESDKDVVTVRYDTGEHERFRFSEAVPFESVGLSGSAPGLQPIEGDDAYPISGGHTLWLASEVEARFEALQSRRSTQDRGQVYGGRRI